MGEPTAIRDLAEDMWHGRVWRRYGGWYDGEPDNLLPAPRAVLARRHEPFSSMARNILGHAAHASTQLRRDLAGDDTDNGSEER